jgi:hypothetical protein
MSDFEKELAAILEEDPLGLLSLKPKASEYATPDERLLASFREISDFVSRHGREPEESRDIGERKLYSRLKGLRESPGKVASLLEYDELGLLKGRAREEPKIVTAADVLEHDPLGLLGDDAAADILTLRHVPRRSSTPEHVAQRKRCDEFERFEPIFKQCQQDLKSQRKTTVAFVGERQIRPGALFIVQGMLVYVGSVGKWEKRNFGNVNARLYCVFENATESNMYLRSLAAAMWKDENSRVVIDANQREMYDDGRTVSSEDQVTGYIYILRSLSQRPEIRSVADLFKIGFSSVPVKERIRNAASEPTYLMAEVKLVEEYEAYNMNPQKFEALIHRFFAEACLNVDVFDNEGRRYTPREWFVVPLRVIEIAVTLLISGEIVNYYYDVGVQEIAPLDE